MECYSCEYKEYTKGDKIPASDCPDNCTIINLLKGFRAVYTSLPSELQEKALAEFPSITELEGIDEKKFKISDY